MSICARLRVALESAAHAGNPGDTAFYLDACGGAGRVLELGCGAGRVAAALERAGHRVTGIDLDADAVAVARERGLDALVADMRDFRLPARFDRVVVPFCGLYCLVTEADQVRCLERARAHLSPGGEVVFDVYGADTFHDQPEDDAFDDEEVVVQIDVDGTRWTVFERSRWWRSDQRIDACYRYVPDDGRGEFEQTIRQRYLLSSQLPGLLSMAGLTLRAADGGFAGEPWRADSDLLVVRAAVAA